MTTLLSVYEYKWLIIQIDLNSGICETQVLDVFTSKEINIWRVTRKKFYEMLL